MQSTEVGETLLDLEDVPTDPPLGSDLPWTKRERAFLEMSRFDLELLHTDGEDLPARVLAKLYNFDRIGLYSDLFYMFR